MPITYQVDVARNFIHETWNGAVSAGELSNYWRAYLADPAVMACRRTLVDIRCGTPSFSWMELESLIRNLVLPILGDRHWRSALLVSNTVQFGVSRQYEVFANIYSQDSIFYDQVTALEWLLSDRPDSRP